MSLPRDFKFVAQNECGETISAGNVDIEFRMWKPDSTNMDEKSWSSETTRTNASTIADGAHGDLGSYVDNSTTGYWGMEGLFRCNPSTGSPAGPVILKMVISPDGGTDESDDDLSIELAVIRFSATGERKAPFIYG